MKTKLIVLSTALAFASLALPLQADQASDASPPQRDQDAAQYQQSPRLGDLRRADDIIGYQIKDDHGQKLGKVKDLALDLKNGRIVAVIVSYGGLMDRKTVAIPPSSFTIDTAVPNELRLNITRDQLTGVPEFSLSHWADSTDTSRIMEIYQRFGAEPYFKGDQSPPPQHTESTTARGQDEHYYAFNGNNALPHLGYVARASKLMGTTTSDMENMKLARVEDFIIDLPAGRVVEVVLGLGGPMRPGAELSPVPPQAFHWNADKTALTLDSTKEALKAAPCFQAGQWDLASEPDRIRSVYSLYHVEPYFAALPMPQNGAQNVRERTDNAPPANLQQANDADLKISDQIRSDISSRENLSLDARNLKITTVDGKVTLTGSVASQSEKDQMTSLATKLVTADRVDNQLQVRGSPTSPVDPGSYYMP